MAALSLTLQRIALKGPFSEAESEAIHQELKAILASSYFRNSRRYPAFLSYVVETSLKARPEENIKERNIGVEAFGRPADYDTNLDPIVRNTACEVRKRLTLYYAEHGCTETHLEISLLPGSYVPEFYQLQPHPAADTLEEHLPESIGLDVLDPALSPSAEALVPALAAHPVVAQADRIPGRWFRSAGFAVLALAVIGVVALTSHWWSAEQETQSLWRDFIYARHDVIIVAPEAPFPPDITANWAKDNPNIALEDLSAIVPPTAILTEHHAPYSVKLDPSVTLADLTNRPVILVGGPTNKWTVTLTDGLRYRMKKDNSGLYVEDSQQGAPRPCSYETSTVDQSVKNDCAIFARFHSALTGNTVMVIAGTGRNGTQAVGQWILSPNLETKLSELFPHGWKNKNIEVVLKTTVIEGKSSAPTIVRAFSW